jgi:cell division protein FtsL
MSEHHHHHHHGHKPDDASVFKQKSLSAIQRRKLFEKILKIFMVFVAILMAIAVVLVYTVF